MNILLHICCGPCAVMPIKRLLDAGHKLTGFFYNPNIHPLAEYLRRREGVAEVAEKYGIPMLWAADDAGYATAEWLHAVQGQEYHVLSADGFCDAEAADCTEFCTAEPNSTEPDRAVPASTEAEKVAAKPADALTVNPVYGRCRYCWSSRLQRTFSLAIEQGFDAFSTTLLYSRYQYHAGIISICRNLPMMHIHTNSEASTFDAVQGSCLGAVSGAFMGDTLNTAIPEVVQRAKLSPKTPEFFYQDFRTDWQAGIDLSKEWGIYRQSYCGCIFSENERYAKALDKSNKKLRG